MYEGFGYTIIMVSAFYYIVNQEQKSAAKDEPSPASKNNLPSKVTSSSSKTAGTPSTVPVTEEEIRAVLMQKTPVTTQDLVAKFKARLRCPEVFFCLVMFFTSLNFLVHMHLFGQVYLISTTKHCIGTVATSFLGS